MPYVNVKLVGKLTKEQKQKIVEEISLILEKIAGKKKKDTYVVIEEHSAENWGVDGRLIG